MRLEFKTDFAKAKENWDRFWNNKKLSRPLVSITVPKDGNSVSSKPAFSACVDKDADKIIDELLDWCQKQIFLAEAIPFYKIDFAPDHFSALLGAELVFVKGSNETGWIKPFIEDWDDVEIKPDINGYWWEKTFSCIRKFKERCAGKLIVSGPHLQGGLDCLSAIRGPEKLAFDLVQAPEKIEKALKQVNRAYKTVFEAIYEELDWQETGDITRHQMYFDGKIHVPQCDFSCMISSEMFERFGIGSLEYQTDLMDIAEYHLDGPDAVRHLERVCEIEKIRCIQWQPGAGAALEKDWTDLYKKIDTLGKKQVIGGGGQPVKDIEFIYKLCDACDHQNFFFVVECENLKQGQNLIEELEKRYG